MISRLSVISGFIAFSSSVGWLILNINQSNSVTSENYEEHQRINSIQNSLSVIWLFATVLTIILVIVAILIRDSVENKSQIYSKKLLFIGMSFVVISPHFSYIFMIVMLDIIFRGV